MPSGPRYRRVLLKLSGEGLMGNREYGLDPDMVSMVAQEIKTVHEMGVQVCLVIGGGNIFRGVSAAASGMDRASGDYMGDAGDRHQFAGHAKCPGAAGRADARAVGDSDDDGLRALYPPPRGTPYGERAGRDLRRGNGQSFFTTDTAAALRAAEMSVDAMLKGTQVDGVYSADPRRTRMPSATIRSPTWTCCRATCR